MGYIRDLAEIKTKEGKYIKPYLLLRAAQLNKPSKEQLYYLDCLKIKRIIDLRNPQEAIDEPDVKLGDDVKYLNYSLVDNDLNGVTHVKQKRKQLQMLKQMETIQETYYKMVSEDYGLNNIREVIREVVLIDDYPTIIHCVTGKDRAGIICAILEYILGVSYEDIVEDYLKQRPIYISKARRLWFLVLIATLNLKQAKKAYDYYAVNKAYIELAFNTINEKFGSMDNFVYDFIGLTKEEIEVFKERVLVDPNA